MSNASYRNKQEGKEKDPEQICTERQKKKVLWNLLDGSENKKLA